MIRYALLLIAALAVFGCQDPASLPLEIPTPVNDVSSANAPASTGARGPLLVGPAPGSAATPAPSASTQPSATPSPVPTATP